MHASEANRVAAGSLRATPPFFCLAGPTGVADPDDGRLGDAARLQTLAKTGKIKVVIDDLAIHGRGTLLFVDALLQGYPAPKELGNAAKRGKTRLMWHGGRGAG